MFRKKQSQPPHYTTTTTSHTDSPQSKVWVDKNFCTGQFQEMVAKDFQRERVISQSNYLGLEGKVIKLELLLQDKNDQIRALREIGDHLEKFVEELQQENSELRRTLSKMWASSADSTVDDRIQELERKLQDKEEEFEGMSQDLKVLQVLEDIQNRKIKELQQQNQMYQQQNEGLRQSINKLEKWVCRLRSEKNFNIEGEKYSSTQPGWSQEAKIDEQEQQEPMVLTSIKFVSKKQPNMSESSPRKNFYQQMDELKNPEVPTFKII